MKELIDLKHFLRFLSVGFIGMVVDNLFLFILTTYTSIFVLLNKLISVEISIAVMFLLNDNWTFQQQSEGTILKRFLKSNSVRFVGLVVVTASFYLLYLSGFQLIIANILGIGVGFSFNYLFENIVTWEKVKINDL